VSIEKAMAREPSDGPAKLIPVESEKMIAFGSVHFWEEDFCLSIMLGVSPLLVP
jgi:hypothetical protein